jgi:hypothetical protein
LQLLTSIAEATQNYKPTIKTCNMKYFLSSGVLTIVTCMLNAQTPFAISNRVILENDQAEIETLLNKKLNAGLGLKTYEVVFAGNFNNLADNDNVNQFNASRIREAEKPGLADKLSTGVVINGEVDKFFPTLVGDVVTYRLKLWSRKIRKGPDKDKMANIYFPLSIVSKISGSNEDNSGTVNDAISYFGAPLTFRLSPNIIDITGKDEQTRFVIGMHHDFRALPVGDTLTDNVEIGFGYYGAFGFSFFSMGDVFDEETDAWIAGRWSLSALVYLFRSGGKFKEAVFGTYDQKSLSGFEFMFRFKTENDSEKKFNLFIGANCGFTKNAPNYKKWDIRLGIGN